MAEPTRYPDTDSGVEPDRAGSTGTSRWQKVIGILGILVILWAGNQMYDQFFPSGPDAPGPGGDTPVENQEKDTDTEDGGGHEPSEDDH